MKKLLVILLTLLMILALPVLVLAEEAATEAATEAAVETDENGIEVKNPETEILEEEGPKTTFGFFPATLAETLPIMGMGMLGIFLVTLVIILAVLVLSKLGGGAKEE